MKLSILGRNRIWKNILVWASFFFVTYTIAGFFIFPGVMKAVLTSQLSQRLHREVKIGNVWINPFGFSVLINGFLIKDVKPANSFISCQTIYLNFQVSSLLQGGFVLRELRVASPRLTATRKEDRRYNFSDLLESSTETQSSKYSKLFKFSVNNIQIINGNIDFVDMPKHTHHTVSDIQISIPFLSNFPKSVEIFIQPAFQANVDGTVIVIKGKSKPFNNSLETSVNLNFHDLNLAKYLEYIPENIGFRLDSGFLDSDILVSFVQSGDQSPIVAVTGSLALKHLTITDLSSRSLLKLDLFDVRIASAILFTQNIRFERIVIQSPSIQVFRSKAGLIHMGLFSQKPGSESAYPPPSPTQATGQYAAAEIKILDGKLTFLNEFFGLKEDILLIPEFSVKNTEIDLAKRNATIDQIVSQNGNILLRREPNGKLDVMELVFPSSAIARSNVAAKPEDQSSESSWVFTLKQILLKKYAIHFEDGGYSPPAILTWNPINLTAENLSTAKNSSGKVSVQSNINKTGVFTVDGTLAFNPVVADLSVDLKRFSLIPLQPYIADRLKIILTGGTISTRGRLKLAKLQKKDLTARFNGETSLLNLGVIEEVNEEDLLNWKSLLIQGIQAGYNPFQIAIREVKLTDFSSRIAINSDGLWNLKEITKIEQKSLESSHRHPNLTSSPTPDRPGETVPLRIDRVTLRNGNIHFNDHFIQPLYNTSLTGLNGTISGLSSKEDQQIEVNISCKQDDSAPISVSGKINPLSKKVFVNIRLDSKEIELSPFTPYSSKYAGYTIQKGKLSANLKYLIVDRKLNSENEIFLDQFTLGDKTNSPEATTLPVALAVSLLTDRNGQIHLSLPVTGSIDDPKFNLWQVVIEVMRKNILVKAATAPFALLSPLVGGNEELSVVEFAYGSSNLDSPGQNRVNLLAKILYERPALKLEISGQVDPINDRDALRQYQFQRRLKVQKMNDLIKKGESVSSVDDIVINPEEYLTYLTKAYKKETFPKPRNFLGFAKDLPGTEMEKLMRANIEIRDEDLRNLASSRGLRVKDALLKTGQIEPDRLFLLERVFPTPTQKDSLKLSRVDLAIK